MSGHASDSTVPGGASEALYSAPLAEFVATRARLAAELRAAGKKDEAKAVLALRKPNASAWALNQLARRAPERLRALYAERAAAERAQASAEPTRLRAAVQGYRRHLEDLVAWVAAHLEEAGSSPSKDHERAIREALDAAAQDPEGRGAALGAGVLTSLSDAENTELPAFSASVSVPEQGRRSGERRESTHRAPRAPPPGPPHAPARADRQAPARANAPAHREESAAALAARRLEEQARIELEDATGALREAERNEAAARAEAARAEEALAHATRLAEHARARVDRARRAAEGARAKLRE